VSYVAPHSDRPRPRGEIPRWISQRSRTIRELQRQGYDVPFLLLLSTLFLTALFLIALQHKDVELTFEQLTDFEKRTYTHYSNTPASLNSTTPTLIYVIDRPIHSESLFKSLAVEEWAIVSKEIQYVTILYESVMKMSGDAWVNAGRHGLRNTSAPNLSIVLFECGCFVSNLLFMNVGTRFNGNECVVLPGFVIPDEYVVFRSRVEMGMEGMECEEEVRNIVESVKLDEYADLIESARVEYEEFRKKLIEEVREVQDKIA